MEPYRYAQAGYGTLLRAGEFRLCLVAAEEDEQPCRERQQREHSNPVEVLPVASLTQPIK